MNIWRRNLVLVFGNIVMYNYCHREERSDEAISTWEQMGLIVGE